MALFPSEDGGFTIAWRRETVRAEFGGGFGASQRSYDQQSQQGFGESTAGTDGAMVGAGADDGEDLPF